MNAKYTVAGLCLALGTSVFAAEVLLDDDFTGNCVLGESLEFQCLDSNDWRATDGTQWAIADGALSNGGTSSDIFENEGGIGKLIDLTGITDTSLKKITVSMEYTLANASEELFVHIRGFVGAAPASTQSFVNPRSTAGNLWDAGASAFDSAYTLNAGVVVDGAVSGTGFHSAIELNDGVAGLHHYSTTFDLSGYAVDNIAAYDYLLVSFTRDASGSSPGVSIDSVNITAIAEPESETLGLIYSVGMAILFVRRRLVLNQVVVPRFLERLNK